MDSKNTISFGGINLGIKLLALDLDGTLLNQNQKISQRNIRVINKAKENGVNIVIATGRTNLGAENYFKELGLQEYLISYNGALIQNIRENIIIKHIPLPLDKTLEILDFVNENNLYANLYLNNNVYANKAGEELEYYKRIMNIEPILIEGRIDKFLNKPSTKLLIIEKNLVKVDEILSVLRNNFSSSLNITKSIEDCIDVMSKNVSKGKALSDLTSKLGIKPEEVAAVGDGDNDLEMIKFAGRSAAVANAETSIKENADYITASNDEHGVAEFIEKFIL